MHAAYSGILLFRLHPALGRARRQSYGIQCSLSPQCPGSTAMWEGVTRERGAASCPASYLWWRCLCAWTAVHVPIATVTLQAPALTSCLITRCPHCSESPHAWQTPQMRLGAAGPAIPSFAHLPLQACRLRFPYLVTRGQMQPADWQRGPACLPSSKVTLGSGLNRVLKALEDQPVQSHREASCVLNSASAGPGVTPVPSCLSVVPKPLATLGPRQCHSPG